MEVARLYHSGTDAPMCQDTRSGGLNDLLASAEIGHDALVDLSRKEAFEAPDDLAFGSAIGGASGDVVAGGLVESHVDDDGAIEGGVGVAVAASIEAVPAGGHPGRGRDRARAAELRERGFRTNPVGVIAKRINSSAAVWAPTPKPSRRVGAVSVVRRDLDAGRPARHVCLCRTWRTVPEPLPDSSRW